MFSMRLRTMRFMPAFFAMFAVAQLVQAQPGASDSGNSNVQAQVPAGKILLTGVTDLAFPTWDGGAGQSATLSGICVWSTTRVYGLSVTSDTGAFELTSTDPAITDIIPFSFSWQEHTGTTAQTIAAYGDTLAGLDAPSKTKDCSEGASTQASMTIAMTEADLAAAIAATYDANLTITVVAE